MQTRQRPSAGAGRIDDVPTTPGADLPFAYSGYRALTGSISVPDGFNTVAGVTCEFLASEGDIEPLPGYAGCDPNGDGVADPAEVCAPQCRKPINPTAVTLHHPGVYPDGAGGTTCYVNEWDILVNPFTWSLSLPSELPHTVGYMGTFSIPMTILHEIVHVLGYAEQPFAADLANAMELANIHYPSGGDASIEVLQPTADAIEGAIARFPAATAEPNLALWRFWPYRYEAGQPTEVENWKTKEAWTVDSQHTPDPHGVWDGDETWELCVNEPIGEGDPSQPWFRRPPGDFYAMSVNGPTSATVRLGLTTLPSSCNDVTGYPIWTKSIPLTSGAMTRIRTSDLTVNEFEIPSGTPPGWYNLCAVIDPKNLIAESSEDDNLIVSERRFRVENSTSDYGLCSSYGD